MLISGKWTAGNSTDSIDVINPATEEVIDQVPRGTESDVEAAVAAAKAAFVSWHRVPAPTMPGTRRTSGIIHLAGRP